MQRFLYSLILAAIFFVASTFGGISIFGMQVTMATMDDGGCMGSACADTHDMDAHGMDCVSHCISAVSPTTVTPAPFTMAFVLLAVVLIAIVFSIPPQTFPRAVERWREGIGKLLLHQHLAPVMLRD